MKTVQQKWRNENFQEQRSEASEHSIFSLQHDQNIINKQLPLKKKYSEIRKQKSTQSKNLTSPNRRLQHFSPAPIEEDDHTLTQSATERFDCLEAKAGLDNVLVKHERWVPFHFDPLDGFDLVDDVSFEGSNGGNFILVLLLDNY